jgi:putative endonuclease
MGDGYTKRFFVYIMANKKNGTLYVGMTSFLARRANEHLYGEVEGFTKKYGLKKLVYYEEYDTFDEAMRREKRLKRWNREWKLEAIEKNNPNWDDLYDEVQE